MVECRWTTGCVRKEDRLYTIGIVYGHRWSTVLSFRADWWNNWRCPQRASSQAAPTNERLDSRLLGRDWKKGAGMRECVFGPAVQEQCQIWGNLALQQIWRQKSRYHSLAPRNEVHLRYFFRQIHCIFFSGADMDKIISNDYRAERQIMGFNLCRLGCCDWSKTKKVCKKTGTGSKRRHSIRSIHKSSIIQAWVGWQGKGI